MDSIPAAVVIVTFLFRTERKVKITNSQLNDQTNLPFVLFNGQTNDWENS